MHPAITFYDLQITPTIIVSITPPNSCLPVCPVFLLSLNHWAKTAHLILLKTILAMLKESSCFKHLSLIWVLISPNLSPVLLQPSSVSLSPTAGSWAPGWCVDHRKALETPQDCICYLTIWKSRETDQGPKIAFPKAPPRPMTYFF